jgi:Domain of unknown function (DUF4192)
MNEATRLDGAARGADRGEGGRCDMGADRARRDEPGTGRWDAADGRAPLGPGLCTDPVFPAQIKVPALPNRPEPVTDGFGGFPLPALGGGRAQWGGPGGGLGGGGPLGCDPMACDPLAHGAPDGWPDSGPLDPTSCMVRLGSPAEVAAAIPHFFGFHPDSSVVILGLTRPPGDSRAVVSHGLRADLSAVQSGPAGFGRWIARRLKENDACEALCVVYPPDAGPVRLADYRRMVAGMCTPLRESGILPLDVLFVADNRWWSFLCDRSRCCPPEGSPIEPGPTTVAALSAYSGLAVLPNRATLAAGFKPYGPEMDERMRRACATAAGELEALERGASRRRADLPWRAVANAWHLADDLAANQLPANGTLSDAQAARLLTALPDVRVRDYLATWCSDDRAGQAVLLAVELGRRAITEHQIAAAFSVAAWASWALGWGAWSRLCLERTFASMPDYTLGILIKQGLDKGVGPNLVREAARGTAQRLAQMYREEEAAAR